MSKNSTTQANLAALQKLTFTKASLCLAACPITGISIEIGIPRLPKVLEYTNPLAYMENARDIAKLPYIEHQKLSPEVLAGTLLALLSHLSLLGDKLSATQRNAYLQNCHVKYLSTALKLFSNCSKRQAEKLPLISLDNETDAYCQSDTIDVLKNYIRTCSDILFPKSEALPYLDRTTVYAFKTKSKIVKPRIDADEKKLFKATISSLYMEAKISKSFYDLLIAACTGENILHLEPSVRARIIAKLSTLTDKANLVVLNSAAKDETANMAATFSAPVKPLTISQILENKRLAAQGLPPVHFASAAEGQSDQPCYASAPSTAEAPSNLLADIEEAFASDSQLIDEDWNEDDDSDDEAF